MPEPLTPEAVLHLGRLARLELTEEEQSRYAGQLSGVVGYIDQLAQVDTKGAEAMHGVTGLTNVLAADEPRKAEDPCAVPAADLLAGVPVREGDFILVRAVLGEGGGA